MSEHAHVALIRSIVHRVSEHPIEVDIRPQTRIADLGIDSVTFAEIVVQIEEALDLDVPFGDWLTVRTVQEVLDMIDKAAATAPGKGVTPQRDRPRGVSTRHVDPYQRQQVGGRTPTMTTDTDRLEFTVTGLDIDVVETVPINWQGREIDSGPIHIGLGDPGSHGVIDYQAGTVEVEFRSQVTFPELAETLQDLGADPSVYAPVKMVIRSKGAVLDGHYLRLAGKGTIESHRLFDPDQTRVDVRAPSQCKPDVGAGSGEEIREGLRNGKSVSWNFNPQEKRVDLTLPEALGGTTHELSLAGSYTLTIADPSVECR